MYNTLPELQIQALQAVTLAVFDVDGVLTDGHLNFLPDGQEVKSFNTLDGLGIKMLHQAGIKTAIITGRRSPQVEKRAQSLGIHYLYQGREDKLVALQELWQATGYSAAQTAYIGDDLPDLAAIRTVAFGATVNGGHRLSASMPTGVPPASPARAPDGSSARPCSALRISWSGSTVSICKC